MAIQLADGFSYSGQKPLDARFQFDSVANMKATAESALYDGCLAYVTANKTYYTFDSTNTTDSTTGKWRELETGGGGGGSSEIPEYETFPTPSAEWNGKLIRYVGENDSENGIFKGVVYTCRIDTHYENYIWVTNAIMDYLGYYRWEDPLYCEVTMGSSGNDNLLQKACIRVKVDSTPTSGETGKLMTSGAVYNALATKQDKLAYSTSEKAIGTWTNGSTLYQRTFSGTLASSVSTTVSSALSSYTVRDIFGVIRTGKQTISVNITFVSGSTILYAAGFMDSSGNIVIYTNNTSLYGSSYEITIRYTK